MDPETKHRGNLLVSFHSLLPDLLQFLVSVHLLTGSLTVCNVVLQVLPVVSNRQHVGQISGTWMQTLGLSFEKLAVKLIRVQLKIISLLGNKHSLHTCVLKLKEEERLCIIDVVYLSDLNLNKILTTTSCCLYPCFMVGWLKTVDNIYTIVFSYGAACSSGGQTNKRTFKKDKNVHLPAPKRPLWPRAACGIEQNRALVVARHHAAGLWLAD